MHDSFGVHPELHAGDDDSILSVSIEAGSIVMEGPDGEFTTLFRPILEDSESNATSEDVFAEVPIEIIDDHRAVMGPEAEELRTQLTIESNSLYSKI